MSDFIGRTLGPYKLEAALGRGGMATVYRAFQTTVKRYVAVKVMSPEIARDSGFVERFTREAEVIASLQHPHILPIIDYGEVEGVHYLVMRYIENGSLEDRMRKHPLSLQESARFIDQIGSALDYAHKRGVVHRDFKPNNVLLDSDDNAYLTDFGIARLTQSTSKLTATGTVMGTPAYMSPEQGSGKPVDGRSDVYSMGIVIYEMVLNRLPFSADTPAALIFQHVYETPTPPKQIKPDLPDAIVAVILRAIAKDPDARYQSAADLARAFTDAARSVGAVPVADPLADHGTMVGGPALVVPAGTPSRGMSTPPAMPAELEGRTLPPGVRIPTPPSVPPMKAAPTLTPPQPSSPLPALAPLPASQTGLTRPATGAGRLPIALIAVVVILILLALGGGGVFVVTTNNQNATSTAQSAAVILVHNATSTAQTAVALLALSATATSTQTFTPSNTPTPTFTFTATNTFTPTPTFTATPSFTFTATNTFTATSTFTFTPANTPTRTPLPTTTFTPSTAPTATPNPTLTGMAQQFATINAFQTVQSDASTSTARTNRTATAVANASTLTAVSAANATPTELNRPTLAQPPVPIATIMPSDVPTTPSADTVTPTDVPANADSPNAVMAQLQRDGLLTSIVGSPIMQLDAADLADTDAHTIGSHTIYWHPLDNTQEVSDFVMRADITWERPQSGDECGLLFRYSEPEQDKQYFYAGMITTKGNLHSYSVAQGVIDPDLVNRPAPAIKQGDQQVNHLLVIGLGNAFRFFVNGKQVGGFTQKKFDKGAVAVAGSSDQAAGVACHFTNIWVWGLGGADALVNGLTSTTPDDVLTTLMQSGDIAQDSATTAPFTTLLYDQVADTKNTAYWDRLGDQTYQNFVISTDINTDGAADTTDCGLYYYGAYKGSGPPVSGIAIYFNPTQQFYDAYVRTDANWASKAFATGHNTQISATYNRMTLVVINGKITVYINGVFVFNASETTFSSGAVGYFMQRGDSPNTETCHYTNTTVWALK